MSSLAFIQLTQNGTAWPVRIDDIDDVRPVQGRIGGAWILRKGGKPAVQVDETTAAVFTAINAQWTAYLAALT